MITTKNNASQREERRFSQDEVNAWREGDTAALEGVNRAANPHENGSCLHDAWDQGFLGFPLNQAS